MSVHWFIAQPYTLHHDTLPHFITHLTSEYLNINAGVVTLLCYFGTYFRTVRYDLISNLCGLASRVWTNVYYLSEQESSNFYNCTSLQNDVCQVCYCFASPSLCSLQKKGARVDRACGKCHFFLVMNDLSVLVQVWRYVLQVKYCIWCIYAKSCFMYYSLDVHQGLRYKDVTLTELLI